MKEPWATDIAAVAAIPSVYCKLSGMVTEADHERWTVADLKPYVDYVVEQFGLDRLMWGSDWPVCLMAACYDRVFSAAMEAVGDLTPRAAHRPSKQERHRLLPPVTAQP